MSNEGSAFPDTQGIAIELNAADAERFGALLARHLVEIFIRDLPDVVLHLPTSPPLALEPSKEPVKVVAVKALGEPAPAPAQTNGDGLPLAGAPTRSRGVRLSDVLWEVLDELSTQQGKSVTQLFTEWIQQAADAQTPRNREPRASVEHREDSIGLAPDHHRVGDTPNDTTSS